jgi:hypothetical protein
MKKLIFFAICLFAAGSVSAQVYYAPRRVVRHRQQPQADDFYKVKVGITGGLNISNTIDANSDYSTGAIAGFNAGLFMELPVVFPFSIQPEVLYSQKGFTAITPDGNLTQRSNYIDVPILAKFKLSPSFNFLVGPQISFPVSTNVTFDNGFNTTNEYNYSQFDQKTILDGVVGVSFDITPTVELRARYTIDLESNDQNNTYLGGDLRTAVYQIGLGFKFR